MALAATHAACQIIVRICSRDQESSRRTMVATRRTVTQDIDEELKVTSRQGVDTAGPAAKQRSGGGGKCQAPATTGHSTGVSPAVIISRAAFVALFCYLVWFVLLISGILAYEGEPILVKSRDLPLHWFDVLFRMAGSALLFALWGVRAAAARFLPSHFDHRANLVWIPAGIYAAQALVRAAIYQLHVAGYIFTPQHWAHDNQSHPPHVMSDHILLASAVHGGLANESMLPLLNWWHAEATGRGRTFLCTYSAAAGSLAALVSAECYFTARYFHPPAEVLLAATLGLVVFQVPLLWYAAKASLAHHVELQLQVAAGARVAQDREAHRANL